MYQASDQGSQMREMKYRCDQCEDSHRKCNKRLPSCTACYSKGQGCSYLKVKGKRNFLSHIDQRITRFKIIQRSEDKQKERNTEELESDYNYIEGNYKSRIIGFPGIYNNTCIQLGNLLSIKRKDLFENMMTLFQFPPNNTNTGNVSFLALIENLGILYKRNVAKELTKEVEKCNISNLDDLRDKAIDNYFKYNNTVLPMFIKSNFNFNSKTEALKLAILIIGIDHMEKDEQVKHVFRYLSFQLEHALRVPHRVKPTLENIQALLVLTSFIKLPFLATNLDKYAYFCHKASDLIGLHLTPPGLTKIERIEREMTYSCLFMSYLFLRVYVGVCLQLPYKPRTLLKEFKIMMKKMKKEKNTKVTLLNNDVEYYFSLAISSYDSDLSSILFSLCILKEKYISRNDVNEDLDGITVKLIKRIEGLKNLYLFILSQITNRIDQSKYSFSQFNYQAYILKTYHYLRFYIYSLKFYYPNKGDIRFRRLYRLGDDDYIAKILSECQLCIKFGTQLSEHYLNYFTVGCFTQCLILLINYKHKSTNNFNDIIENGINYIKQLSKFERFRKFAALNLTVLNFIQNNKVSQQAILDSLGREYASLN